MSGTIVEFKSANVAIANVYRDGKAERIEVSIPTNLLPPKVGNPVELVVAANGDLCFKKVLTPPPSAPRAPASEPVEIKKPSRK